MAEDQQIKDISSDLTSSDKIPLNKVFSSKEAKNNIISGFLLLLVQLTFSGYSVISVLYVKNIQLNIFVLIFFRGLIAALMAVILALVFEKKFIIPRSNLKWNLLYFLIFGPISTSLNPIMYLYVIQYTSGSYVVILGQLIPIFNTIFSWILGIEDCPNKKESKTLFQLFGIIIGCTFAIAIPSIGFSTKNSIKPWDWVYGTLIAVLNNLTFSLYHVLQSKLFYRRENSELQKKPFTVNAYCNLSGALLYSTGIIPYLALNGHLFKALEPIAALPILYSSIANSTFGFSAMIWCVRKSNPVIVGASFSLQVATSILFLNLFAKERMFISQYLCCVGVVIGVLFVVLAPTFGPLIDKRHKNTRSKSEE